MNARLAPLPFSLLVLQMEAAKSLLRNPAITAKMGQPPT
jgi:hypothetical protein